MPLKTIESWCSTSFQLYCMRFLKSSRSAEYVKVFYHDRLLHACAVLVHIKYTCGLSALPLDSRHRSVFGPSEKTIIWQLLQLQFSSLPLVSESERWLRTACTGFLGLSQVVVNIGQSRLPPLANNITGEYGWCCHKQSETNQLSWNCQATEMAVCRFAELHLELCGAFICLLL